MKHWLTSYTKHTKSVSFILWSTFFPQWGTNILKKLSFSQDFREHKKWQPQQQLFWFKVEIAIVSAWDTAGTSTVKAKKPEKKKEKGHCWLVGTLSWWLLSPGHLPSLPCAPGETTTSDGQSLKCSHCLICSCQNTLGRDKSCQY